MTLNIGLVFDYENLSVAQDFLEFFLNVNCQSLIKLKVHIFSINYLTGATACVVFSVSILENLPWFFCRS